jgi:hypothetical protein
MNILHNSNLAKVMSFTMGGDAVGQARGQTGSRGGRPTQHMAWGYFAGTLGRG